MSIAPAAADLQGKSVLARLSAWAGQYALPLSLALGAVLRLIGSGSRSLQYDDTFSIFLSARSLPEILSGTAADTMPPLYYFLLHFWLGISQQAWFIRLLTVLLSLGVIAIQYALVEHLFGRAAAGWAAFLTAISGLQIYHAQDVRMYALLLAGQSGYLYFFARSYFPRPAHPPASWQNWLGLVLCGTLAMYSHNLAIFALVIPSFYLLLKWDWRAILRLAAAQLVIGLLALPWLVLIPGQIAKVQKAWTLPQPGIVEVLQAVIMFTASLPLPFLLLAIVAVLSLQILVMLGIETWRARKTDPQALFLVCALLPPVMLFVASYLMRPIFIPRGFLISSLAYYGLAGLVIARAWKRGVGVLILGGFVLAAGLSLPSFYTYAEFPRSPYRSVVAELSSVGSGAVIVHENKLSYFPARYYAPDLNQVFVADPPDSPNNTFEPASQAAMQIFPQASLEAATTGYADVYFVYFEQSVKEYTAAGFSQHPDLTWLDQHFRRVDSQAVGDLNIAHYQR